MFRSRRALVAAVLCAIVAAAPARADSPLPKASSPEEVGLSSERLKRLEAVSQAHFDAGTLPGAQMVVVRKGKIASATATATPKIRCRTTRSSASTR
jgi:CubicO group peptidase (beta-lactamase class C family)